jgi:hypothetical protein
MSESASFQNVKKSWVRSLRFSGVAGHHVGPCDAKMCQCCKHAAFHHDARTIENFLKLSHGLASAMHEQIGLAARIHNLESTQVRKKQCLAESG